MGIHDAGPIENPRHFPFVCEKTTHFANACEKTLRRFAS